MKNFVITSSSTCDMTLQFLISRNIYYVSFYYYLDDIKFYDEFFKQHTVDEYYEKIKTCSVKTSQPDPEQYKDLWVKLIDQGYDILHIELSSGISGAVNSALIAKSMVEEVRKDAKVYVVDSLLASGGVGLLLDLAYKYKQSCNDIDKVRDYVESTKTNVNSLFFVENLDQLIKGGRVSKVSGSIGKLLNIVPVLHVDSNGKLESIKKSRGLNNAIDEVINLMKSNINDDSEIIISHSNCNDNAIKLSEKIKSTFPNCDLNNENITNIGTVIGGHTGKGCVAVFYLGKGRV